MAFTKAIRQAAPDALEVADRWYLLQNLSTAVEKTCRRHRECLRQPAGAEAIPPLATRESPLLERVRRRHAEVNELASTGLSLSAIGPSLQLDRKTVRRYRNKDLAGLLSSAQDRGHGVLDPFIEHVQHRFQAGCTSSMQLYREVSALGYTGGYHVVNRYVAAMRKGVATPHPGSDTQPSRHHLMDHAVRGDTQPLGHRPAGNCPQRLPWRPLRSLTSRGTSRTCSAIAAATCSGTGSRRPSWAARTPSASSPTPSARTSRPSLPASPWPYSSGIVEGHVNRIKTIKRQMYGRASFALLRARVLLQP